MKRVYIIVAQLFPINDPTGWKWDGTIAPFEKVSESGFIRRQDPSTSEVLPYSLTLHFFPMALAADGYFCRKASCEIQQKDGFRGALFIPKVLFVFGDQRVDESDQYEIAFKTFVTTHKFGVGKVFRKTDTNPNNAHVVSLKHGKTGLWQECRNYLHIENENVSAHRLNSAGF